MFCICCNGLIVASYLFEQAERHLDEAIKLGIHCSLHFVLLLFLIICLFAGFYPPVVLNSRSTLAIAKEEWDVAIHYMTAAIEVRKQQALDTFFKLINCDVAVINSGEPSSSDRYTGRSSNR
jgi:hypothetical protein